MPGFDRAFPGTAEVTIAALQEILHVSPGDEKAQDGR